MGTKRERRHSSNRGTAAPTEPCVHSILAVKCLSAASDQLSPRRRRLGKKKKKGKKNPSERGIRLEGMKCFPCEAASFPSLVFLLMTLMAEPEVHLQQQLTAECSQVIKVSLLWCWSLLLSQWPFLLENLHSSPSPPLSSCLLLFSSSPLRP